MLKLAKGGKWVFGWVLIGPDMDIRIPPAAASEYGFTPGKALVFTPGSRTSGGFGLGRQDLLVNHAYLSTRLPGRGIFQTGGTVCLPAELGVKAGDKLLVVRGSGHALGFCQRGPIIKTAEQHAEIEVFSP